MPASLEGLMLLISAHPALPASVSFTCCTSSWQRPVPQLDAAVLQPSLVFQAAPSSAAVPRGRVFETRALFKYTYKKIERKLLPAKCVSELF